MGTTKISVSVEPGMRLRDNLAQHFSAKRLTAKGIDKLPNREDYVLADEVLKITGLSWETLLSLYTIYQYLDNTIPAYEVDREDVRALQKLTEEVKYIMTGKDYE